MKRAKEDPLYVGIGDGTLIRKNLLESSKEIVLALKNYESFKGIREEKRSIFEGLRSDVRGISLLLGRLRNSMPSVNMPKKPIKKEAPKEVKKEKEVQKPKQIAPASEIERLEKELDDIEKELGNLG